MEHSEQEKQNNNDNHSDHHKHMMEDFKRRFWISTIVTVPILVLSPLIQSLIGLDFSFPGRDYAMFVLSTFIFFYGGWPFLKGIYDELSDKAPGMMTLIAVAISVAYFYSSAVVFGLEGRFFFWELATLIDVMLLGHWLEMKSVMGASKALEKLAQLMPDTAHLKEGNEVRDIKISKLEQGNVIVVKAGEKIPADGTIKKGDSYIDESMLTGESKPVEKETGDEVIGGSINGDSVLEVEVEKTGEDSYLNKVIRLVEEAQEAKSKTQRLADVAAKWLTVIAISVGTATLIYWLIQGPDIAFAVERMATVMVITCPHALGLAIPLVGAVSTSLSAKNGLLIRNRTAFENSRNITSIVFDKTGTLTKGEFGVNRVYSFSDDYPEDKILQLSASIEQSSEHPIGKSIREQAKDKDLEILEVMDFEVLKGEGVKGAIENQKISLLSQQALSERGIEMPDDFETDEAATIISVVIDEKVVGAITLEDQIREESYDAIKQLQERNIKCYMLTGDNEKIAKKVSDELGLDGYFAEVLPHEKQNKIKEIQEKEELVAMTGDGINDAPALAQADIGIAIGSGTDVAAETADIILVESNPKDVLSLILFGKETYKKMIQNLFWATGYNVIAIPLAAGVLYGAGILISPALGAALMSLSTVIVAINAKFLSIDRD
mgnify:CR=1 FL=1